MAVVDGWYTVTLGMVRRWAGNPPYWTSKYGCQALYFVLTWPYGTCCHVILEILSFDGFKRFLKTICFSRC